MGVNILGIGGSLREGSQSLRLLERSLQSAARAGADIDLFDLKCFPLPLYDDRSDIDTYPPNVHLLLDKVQRADGLILCTPVYHGILSGALKNALDFLELLYDCERPWLEGKVVGLISVAGGRAGDNAINSMAFACQALHAWTLPFAVAVGGDAFDDEGTLQEPRVKERLARIGREIVSGAELLRRETVVAHPSGFPLSDTNSNGVPS